MKKLLVMISAVFFIAALPLFVHAAGPHMQKEGFNNYIEDPTPALQNNHWKNEYYPQHQARRMHNRYGYAMRNQHRVGTYYQRHNYLNYRITRYFYRCY